MQQTLFLEGCLLRIFGAVSILLAIKYGIENFCFMEEQFSLAVVYQFSHSMEYHLCLEVIDVLFV